MNKPKAEFPCVSLLCTAISTGNGSTSLPSAVRDPEQNMSASVFLSLQATAHAVMDTFCPQALDSLPHHPSL